MSTTVREFARLLRIVIAIALAASCRPQSALGRPDGLPPQSGDAAAGSGPDLSPPLPPLTPSQGRRLALCELALLKDSRDIGQSDRRRAAMELADMDRPEAHALLGEGLRTKRLAVLLAIAEALVENRQPHAALLDPLIAALRTGPREAWDGLSRAIARHGAGGFVALSAVATDGEVAAAERAGPVYAVGAFRTRSAANLLIERIEPPRREPAAIVTAACQGLDRLTGLSFGIDRDRWLRWHQETRGLDDDAWLACLIEGLDARRSALEHRVRGVEERLGKTFETFFPTLPYERQVEELPLLLEDDLEVLRRYAIESIGRLARDGAIPLPLRQKLTERLGDPSPSLRLAAARLLGQFSHEGLPDAVARRLAVESDTEVIAQYLAILAERPSPLAAPRLCDLITHETLAEAAATALWSLAIANGGRTSQTAIECASLREAYAGATSRGLSNRLASLLALLGDEGDVALLLPALDEPDPERRMAVAAGLAHRGRKDPLVARAAGDEAIYPYAVLAITRGEHSLARLQELLRLEPPAAHKQAWADSVRRMAASLGAGDVLVADDALAALAYADPSLRRDVLLRLAELPPESLPSPERRQVLGRLVPVQLGLGEAQKAHALLEAVPRDDPDTLASLRLEAALRAQRFARAVEIEDDPLAWIVVLEHLISGRVEEARALRDEIARRFADQLVGNVKARFDAAAAGLPPANGQPAPRSEV